MEAPPVDGRQYASSSSQYHCNNPSLASSQGRNLSAFAVVGPLAVFLGIQTSQVALVVPFQFPIQHGAYGRHP
ncbi:unannotated protein [freshwater metagenome]|uniref:Unannotated protein n=1 Tax=freshwater metagenome TaxID=449393 RepID=A0A6J6LXT2_9ZZZZ